MRTTRGIRVLQVLVSLLLTVIFSGLCETSLAGRVEEEIKPLIEGGKYKLAREKAVYYFGKNPGDPETIYYMALLEPDGDLSRDYLQKIVENYPGHRLADDALYRLGLFYYALGFYRTAGQRFEDLLKNYPGSELGGYTYYYIGLSKLAIGEISKSIESFEKVMEFTTEKELILKAKVGLIDSYFAEDNYAKSIELCEELVEDDAAQDMKPYVLFTLAKSYEKMGDGSKASKVYSDILSGYPDSYEAEQLKNISKVPSSSGYISYSIQIGAFVNLENAMGLKDKMEKKGYKVKIGKKEVNNKTFFVVLLGTYGDHDTAASAVDSLYTREGIRGQTVRGSKEEEN